MGFAFNARSGSALLLGAALAAPLAAQDIPPPVPAIRTADQIPGPAPTSRSAAAKDAPSPQQIDVRVLGAGGELWAGTLSVAEYGGARVNLDVQDFDPRCYVAERRYPQRRNAVQMRLNPVNRQVQTYRLEVTWSRPSQDCSEQGSRSSGFELQVELPSGEMRTLEGDGGLRVELTRRP
ncbi:MAG: hypothetical protein V2J14_05065 [Erythrobacter sp.]|jgi:hypothetical protein|nr:hypothetical protein [Erythrobacter sp.]